MNWWRTLVELPDCNPIKNLWHELKEYNRQVIKPTMKQQLINGIQQFWETVSIDKCKKYINHLKKVLPKVIELNGAANVLIYDHFKLSLYLYTCACGFSMVMLAFWESLSLNLALNASLQQK